MEGVTDDKIIKLAADIGGSGKLSELAIGLGIKNVLTKMTKYTQMNKDSNDFAGTKQLLIDGRVPVPINKQVDFFRKALDNAGLTSIGESHLTGVSKRGKRKRKSAPPDDTERESESRVRENIQTGKPKKRSKKSKTSDPEPMYVEPKWRDKKTMYETWGSDNKGKALILTNEVSEQEWAKEDHRNMEEILTNIGFSVESKATNTSVNKATKTSKILADIKEFIQKLDEEPQKPQTALVYITSHRNENGLTGSGPTVSYTSIQREFSEVFLKEPKVIIFDSCWGDKTTVCHAIAKGEQPEEDKVAENVDLFTIHSSTRGKKAWADEDHGSWFTTELCKVVKEQMKRKGLEDLVTLMMRVTDRLRHRYEPIHVGSEERTAQCTTLTLQGVNRKLYFFPNHSE